MGSIFGLRSRVARMLTAPVREPRRAPRARLSAEQLEAREVPAAISFTFSLDESAGSFGLTTTQRNLFISDLQVAGQLWANRIAGDAPSAVSLEVRVLPSAALPSNVYATCGPTAVVVANSTYEPGTLYEGRTGTDPNGTASDITMNFNTAFLQSTGAFFDPSGIARTGSVPTGQTDVITVAAHELGHGLGILSNRLSNGFIAPGDFGTTFDRFVTGTGTNLSFTGTQAQAINGGPVPLTVGSFSHVGNGATLADDLMYASLGTGVRKGVSALDAAVLGDQGWIVKPVYSVVDVSQVTASGTTFVLNSQGDVFRLGAGGSRTLVQTQVTDIASGQGEFFVLRSDGVVLKYNTGTSGFDVSVSGGIVQIGSGQGEFFVLRNDGNVYRYNAGGYVDSVNTQNATQIGSGQGQFFVLLNTGNVYRYNGGNSYVDSVNTQNITQIASGQGEFFVLRNDGNVYRYNAGGYVDSVNTQNVKQIASGQGQFFVLLNTGNVYRYNAGGYVDSVNTQNITQIASGQGHFFILRSDGNAFRYDNGGYVNTGATGISQIASGQGQFFVLRSGGRVYRYDNGVYADSVTGGITQIGSGQNQFFVLRNDGWVFRYNGGNSYVNSVTGGITQIGSGHGQFFVLRNDGNVYRYSGGNSYADSVNTQNVTQIASAQGQFFILRNDGVVFRYFAGGYYQVATSASKLAVSYDTLYVSTTSGGVIKIQFNATQVALSPPVTVTNMVAPRNDSIYVLGSNNTVYRYNAATNTWTLYQSNVTQISLTSYGELVII